MKVKRTLKNTLYEYMNINKDFLHSFQDGIEFSTPRIHNPIYEIADGCFNGNDIYDYNNNRLNQPLFSNKALSLQQGSLLMVLGFNVFNVFMW